MSEKVKNEYEPDVVTPPGETLLETLQALGMRQAELATRIGKTPKALVDIIKHNAEITPDTAMELEKALGIPASFWMNRERRYRESLARKAERERMAQWVPWLKSLPVREMIKAGLIRDSKDKVDLVDQVLRYFGVVSPDQWREVWLSADAAYRKSKVFNLKPEANSVWLRRGELQAQQIQSKPFDRDKFISALKGIRGMTRTSPSEFKEKAVQLCAEAGVAVVFTPPIVGAPVYGATRWLTPDKALIQLSLRGKWEDILWFTFFHEAAHIILHLKKDVFVEGSGNDGEREDEADRFVRDFLIPPNHYSRLSAMDFRRVSIVEKFAAELGISPAIVVGRLQHDKRLGRDRLNGLRRRFEFAKHE